MKQYLLPETGNWYKSNLHCHTVCSDGAKTPEEIKTIYRDLGYSVVAYTDHDVFLHHDELNDAHFLALHGFELEINGPEEGSVPFQKLPTCHICMIALDPDTVNQPCWHREKYLFGNAPKYRDLVRFDESEPDYERAYTGEGISDIIRRGREAGFFVTYNHPTWSRENYPIYMRYRGMNAMEMFNGGCITEGYEDYNPRVYDDLLSEQRLYCIGADDNHNLFEPTSRRWDSGRAFTMISAPSLDYRAITNALQNGDFYASEAPLIHALWIEDGTIHIECSPADHITCIVQSRRGHMAYAENGMLLTEAEFPYEPQFGYFRITVTDTAGRHACTNAYFPDAILEK